MTDDPVPPEGWFVRLTKSDGTVLRPTIADDPTWEPSLRDKPEARVPVPRDEKWLTLDETRVDAAAWKDGQRLPIDHVGEILSESGGTVTLVLRGGDELDTRVQRDVGNEPAWQVAEDLVQTNTALTADVDQPQTDPITDQILQQADAAADWQDWFETALNDPQLPVTVDGSGNLVQQQTAWLITTDEMSINAFTVTDSNAEGGEAANMNTDNHDTTASISPGYEIPGGNVGFAVRMREGSAVTNTQVFAEGFVNGQRRSLIQVDAFGSSYDHDSNIDGDPVASGSATVTLDLLDTIGPNVGQSDEGLVFDSIVVYDARYHSVADFDNAPSGSPPRLATPQEYAAGVPVDSDTTTSTLGIEAATLSINTDATASGQALGISADGGQSFNTASQTTEHTVSYSPAVDSSTARLTLAGHGTQSGASPTTGITPQTVTFAELRADLENIPRLLNETFDGDLGDVLREIADETGAIWEVQQQASGQALVWTRPGQRQAGDPLAASDWSIRKDESVIVEAATVVGSRVSGDESITVNGLDTDQQLSADRLIPGTERVVSASSGEVYEPAVDYYLKANTGALTPRSAGSISDGETLDVSYDRKISGRAEASDWTGDPTTDRKVTIPGLSSPDACEQAARRLIDRQGDARIEATATLADIDPGQPVTEVVDVTALPTAQSYRIRELTNPPQGPTLTLGVGETVEEAVNVIRRTVGQQGERI